MIFFGKIYKAFSLVPSLEEVQVVVLREYAERGPIACRCPLNADILCFRWCRRTASWRSTASRSRGLTMELNGCLVLGNVLTEYVPALLPNRLLQHIFFNVSLAELADG